MPSYAPDIIWSHVEITVSGDIKQIFVRQSHTPRLIIELCPNKICFHFQTLHGPQPYTVSLCYLYSGVLVNTNTIIKVDIEAHSIFHDPGTAQVQHIFFDKSN